MVTDCATPDSAELLTAVIEKVCPFANITSVGRPCTKCPLDCTAVSTRLLIANVSPPVP